MTIIETTPKVERRFTLENVSEEDLAYVTMILGETCSPGDVHPFFDKLSDIFPDIYERRDICGYKVIQPCKLERIES